MTGNSTDPLPVAVFEADLPPALAFIRSLGRAGVPVRAYARRARAAGRYSRYATSFAIAPPVVDADRFLEWLHDEVERNGPFLVAPTSDYIAYAVAEYDERHGTDLGGGMGGPFGPDAVWDCLFKDRFARRMEEIDFPVPAWAAPTSVDEAVAEAERIGYPVVLKLRSHAGVGIYRGAVVGNETELRASFAPVDLNSELTVALRRDPGLAYPLLQHFMSNDGLEVISVTGHIDADGKVSGVECSQKVSQWGNELCVGTLFESIGPPPWLDHALEGLRHVLRAAIFEFEMLVDSNTGDYWALEINPRGFGQMSMSVDRGSDLPRLWYEAATGRKLPDRPGRARPSTQWCMGTPYLAGAAVDLVRGPNRGLRSLDLARRAIRPTTGAVHSWTDPAPGIAFALWVLRHPGGLFRPFLEN